MKDHLKTVLTEPDSTDALSSSTSDASGLPGGVRDWNLSSMALKYLIFEIRKKFTKSTQRQNADRKKRTVRLEQEKNRDTKVMTLG